MSFVHPPSVSNSGEIPTYPWFEEQAASKNASAALLEQNHIAEKNHVDRSVISFGNQNRTDKVGFGVREAVERNGNYLGGRVEKLASEEREKTIMTSLDARSQMAKDFSNVYLVAKENQIEAAANIGEMKTMMLTESLRNEAVTLEQGAELRQLAGALAAQQVCETGKIMAHETWQLGDLKNHETLNYSKTMARMEEDFNKLEFEQVKIVKDLEKGAGLLGIQAESHHGDTNRRAANYRSGVDSRLDSFGAAQALLFADLRNDLAVQAANNTARLEDCCCETKAIIGEGAGAADALLRANNENYLRDALSAQENATLLFKVSPTGKSHSRCSSRSSKSSKSSRSSHSSHSSKKSKRSKRSHRSGQEGRN